MFGDDPVKDIKGSRDAIGAITFQKLHSGVKLEQMIVNQISFLRHLKKY